MIDIRCFIKGIGSSNKNPACDDEASTNTIDIKTLV